MYAFAGQFPYSTIVPQCQTRKGTHRMVLVFHQFPADERGENILKSFSENQLFSGFNLLLCPNGNWKEVKERQ
jgi:hypothetical protein